MAHHRRGLEEDVIQDLIEHGYNIRRNGISNYTVMKNSRIIFLDKIPDHTDDIKSSRDIPSWKRMCYCILKMTTLAVLWVLVLAENNRNESIYSSINTRK